mmetsp:Transcript_82408/g.228641  ORF Transcript_82408/g.228641 Transcript_82408/m.228641 type:complete len:466 (+) Transcript_82408:100-1497(+)|eukprot:CAMPEP_0179147848 /NCGR_PEP_ID=MMETSP0796-20121207/71500_1 /TAXON_ID=73915 /ORGANISM="Pyrodinium bahamense, Strain pbaha01" /LENGTH=465 /DNA_ID=CAMNT_0020848489 /DNA_START=95 /DNA_END=1492 /DNA_ORIENTATION=+
MKQSESILNVTFCAASLVSMGMSKVSTSGFAKPGFRSSPEDMCSQMEPDMSSSLVQSAYQTSRLQRRPEKFDPFLLHVPAPLAPVVPRGGKESLITHGVPRSTAGTEPKAHSDATVETSHVALEASWPPTRHLAVTSVAGWLQEVGTINTGQRLPALAGAIAMLSSSPTRTSVTFLIVAGIVGALLVICAFAAIRCHQGAQQPQAQSAWDRALEKGDLAPARSTTRPARHAAPPGTSGVPHQGEPDARLAPVGSVVQLPPSSLPGLAPTEPYLCPELVVPAGSVCHVSVPLALPSSDDGSTLIIEDVVGVPLFKVAFSLGSDSATGDQSPNPCVNRISLLSFAHEHIFAFCCPAEGGGRPGFGVCRHAGALFADIREDARGPSAGYSISTIGSLRVHFQSESAGRDWRATDKHGRVLVITETSAARRSVRIGSLVDAGLLLLSLIAVEVLERRRARDETLAVAGD